MIRGALFSLTALAVLAVACVTVDPPAPFVKADAGAAEPRSDAGAYERCRLLDRQFVTGARARVYGEAPGPQAVCVTLRIAVPAAGPGAILFCVAGALENVSAPIVSELTADLQSCAYCADVQTNCTYPDGGADASPTACATSYAVLTGRARIVRFSRTPGETVWIDIGDLEVARVTRREGGELEIERRDCIFADGLTLQGTLERGSMADCTGVEATACAIANSAASRFP